MYLKTTGSNEFYNKISTRRFLRHVGSKYTNRLYRYLRLMFILHPNKLIKIDYKKFQKAIGADDERVVDNVLTGLLLNGIINIEDCYIFAIYSAIYMKVEIKIVNGQND